LIFLYSFLKLFFSFCAFVWFHRLFVGMAYTASLDTHTHQFGKCLSFIPISSTGEEKNNQISHKSDSFHDLELVGTSGRGRERHTNVVRDEPQNLIWLSRVQLCCCAGIRIPCGRNTVEHIIFIVVERTF
jgi:hypothetical protein